jgi:hypothetical protein
LLLPAPAGLSAQQQQQPKPTIAGTVGHQTIVVRGAWLLTAVSCDAVRNQGVLIVGGRIVGGRPDRHASRHREPRHRRIPGRVLRTPRSAHPFVIGGNPLADIRNTRKVHLVMKSACIDDPTALLAQAEGRIGPPPTRAP